MKRTQLYLEEDTWKVLHVRARQGGTSISELVRQAVRERYLGKAVERKRAMRAFAGIRENRPEFADSEAYVRELRHGSRLEKLAR